MRSSEKVIRDLINIEFNAIRWGHELVIPAALCKQIWEELFDRPMGIVKIKWLASS